MSPTFLNGGKKIVKSNNVGATTLGRITITTMAIIITGKSQLAVGHIYIYFFAYFKISKSNKVGATTLGRMTITIMVINIIGKLQSAVVHIYSYSSLLILKFQKVTKLVQ